MIPGTPSIPRAKNERKNPKPAGDSGAVGRRWSREAAFALGMTALHRTPAADASSRASQARCSRGGPGASSPARPPPGCAGPAARRAGSRGGPGEPGKRRQVPPRFPPPRVPHAASGAALVPVLPPPRCSHQPGGRRRVLRSEKGEAAAPLPAPGSLLPGRPRAARQSPLPAGRSRALTMAKPESSAEVRLEAFSLARLR